MAPTMAPVLRACPTSKDRLRVPLGMADTTLHTWLADGDVLVLLDPAVSVACPVNMVRRPSSGIPLAAPISNSRWVLADGTTTPTNLVLLVLLAIQEPRRVLVKLAAFPQTTPPTTRPRHPSQRQLVLQPIASPPLLLNNPGPPRSPSLRVSPLGSRLPQAHPRLPSSRSPAWEKSRRLPRHSLALRLRPPPLPNKHPSLSRRDPRSAVRDRSFLRSPCRWRSPRETSLRHRLRRQSP